MTRPITKALEIVDAARGPAVADPTNILKAMAYWNALRSVKGDDYRSGQRLLDAFRTIALNSPEGAYEFARTYMELSDLSGDVPDLDEPLRMSLSAAVGKLPLDKADLFERLITPANMWERD